MPHAAGCVRQSRFDQPRTESGGGVGGGGPGAGGRRRRGRACGHGVWTSGATEANNLALFGVANYQRDTGRHIVTARTEHKAVLDPCRELERRGWRVTYLTPGRGGLLDPAQVAAALEPDTVLVSIMHINNEIGVIQDIAAIAAVCAAHGTARLHVDAAQSIGKCPVDFSRQGVDLMSLSAHKSTVRRASAHWSYRARPRAPCTCTPLQFGGGQERDLRSGTVATHQVVGMGLAFELARAALAAETGASRRCANACGGASHRSAACFATESPTCRGAPAQRFIRRTSKARACSPPCAAASPSRPVPRARRRCRNRPMCCARWAGTPLSESSLRFGLGRFTTEADVDTAIAAVTRAVERLRRVAASERHRHMNYTTLRPPGDTAAARRAPGDGIRPPVHRGTAGDRPQGTWVQFDVHVAAGIIRAARFLAFACPHIIAVADWMAQRAAGTCRPGPAGKCPRVARAVRGADREAGPAPHHRRRLDSGPIVPISGASA